ncbi:MAG: pyruvate formate-lyase activating enzyme [Deltaproteobacteria bacterium]|nr:pyruvate formate-lyase activating enzyme [Deltaproteobacteria bacterium]
MSRFLMIDIGAGTMDILWVDTQNGAHFKAVAPSPVRTIADQINQTQGPLVVTGVEMGGGSVTRILKERAQQDEVIISPSAAATLHHDMDRVRSWGLVVADEAKLNQAIADSKFTQVEIGDVEPNRLNRIVSGLGLPLTFDAVTLCGQDHGVAPKGVSHLDFRHNLFRELLDRSPYPHELLFSSDQIPESFNRLRAMVKTAESLDTREVYVMDSGMAAVVGASQDRHAGGEQPVLVLDIATSHTVAAVMEKDALAAMLEYHTADITRQRLDALLVDLSDGKVNHTQILAEGGHGAYLRKAVGFSNIESIIATGPKRRLMVNSQLPITWGAPWGDNMMTGTVGMLESLRRRKGLPPIAYL